MRMCPALAIQHEKGCVGMDDRGEKCVRRAALDCLYGMRYLINGRDAIRTRNRVIQDTRVHERTH